jgi:hypothetical protein
MPFSRKITDARLILDQELVDDDRHRQSIFQVLETE